MVLAFLQSSSIVALDQFVGYATHFLESVLLFEILGFPFLILWILCGCLYFTWHLRLLPLRVAKHTLKVLRGVYDKPDDVGKISHLEAVYMASLGTIGLGSVSGVAIAVSAGGAGAVFWMIAIGFLGVSVKCGEVIMAQKYRVIDQKSQEIFGAPFTYIKIAFHRYGFPRLGSITSKLYALSLFGTSIGAANMFQASQTFLILEDTFPALMQHSHLFAASVVTLVGLVTIGGIKAISKLGTLLIPVMFFGYIGISLTIVIAQYTHIPYAINTILQEAWTPVSATGGALGALVAGAIRSIYTTETGGGTSSIAHAPVKTSEPASEGLVAALETFVPLVVAFTTGFVLVLTDAHTLDKGVSGILMTKYAFSTVSTWFPVALTISIPFLAITTIMAWHYYGRVAWYELFGKKSIALFHVVFLTATYYGVVSSNHQGIIRFSDLVWVSATIPNILGLYLLRHDIKNELNHYLERLEVLPQQKTVRSAPSLEGRIENTDLL